MKKLAAIAPLLLGAQLSHAQTPIKAGTVQVGGGINYTHYGQNVTGNNYDSGYSTNSLLLNPYAGIFVADNLVVGLGMSYATGDESFSRGGGSPIPGSNSLASQFRGGPFVQYYRMLSEQFGLVGTLSGGYEHDVDPATGTGSVGTEAKGAFASLTPGIVFFPIGKLSLGASIGGLSYSHLSLRPTVSSGISPYEATASTFGAGFGLSQLTFSGTYYFRR